MTAQEMIDFIKTSYDDKKGIRKKILGNSFSSLEVKKAIEYLQSLDSTADVLGNYELFLKLISYFNSALYRRARVAKYTGEVEGELITSAGIMLVVATAGVATFIPGFMDYIKGGAKFIQSQDPLASTCRTANANLEMALVINDFATSNVLLDILRIDSTSVSGDFRKGLLAMKYADFQKLFSIGNEINLFYSWQKKITQKEALEFSTTKSFSLAAEEWKLVQDTPYPFDLFLCLLDCLPYALWTHLDVNGKEKIHSFFVNCPSDNRIQIKSFPCGLKYLHASPDHGLFTQANIEKLLIPENHAFLTNINSFNLTNIPAHLRTQESFEEMLRLARGDNPTEVVNAYITRLIGFDPNNRGGDSQSTHKKSVHDSVALSLKRLNQLYSLSESQIQEQVLEFEQFTAEIQRGDFQHLCEEGDGENRCDKVAIRSIARLIRMSKQWGLNTVKEEQTGYPLSKIIALMWKAAKDEANHLPNSLNAKENLVRGLAHIQRIYNYGSKQGNDRPSCDGGTINDFVGTLNNIHCDVIIILINETSISAMSITYAETIFLEKFTQKIEKDDHFMQAIDQEISANHWVSPKLSQLYEQCVRAIEEKIKADTLSEMTRAQFKSNQIKAINIEMAPWIKKNITALRENKCMFEHAKRRYNAIHNPQVIVKKQEIVKDDFEKLLAAIENAKAVQKRMPTSSLFKTVNLQKIDDFCAALREKSYSDTMAWLQDNRGELKIGRFGSSLQQAFLKDDKPFDCPRLDVLEQWVEYSAVDNDLNCFSFGC